MPQDRFINQNRLLISSFILQACRMFCCSRRRNAAPAVVLLLWVKFTKWVLRVHFKGGLWARLGHHLQDIKKRGGDLKTKANMVKQE